jgi:hypothetical protein
MNWEKVSKNYTTATLKKNAHKEKLDEVFLDESWPETPFIEVAKQHGLTQQSKRKVSDAHHLREIQKNLDKNVRKVIRRCPSEKQEALAETLENLQEMPQVQINPLENEKQIRDFQSNEQFIAGALEDLQKVANEHSLMSLDS